MIFADIFTQNQNSKNKKLKDKITKWHNNYKKIKNEENEIVDELRNLDISDRVRILFDFWAKNDTYGKMMCRHMDAIKTLLSKQDDVLFPAYVFSNKKESHSLNAAAMEDFLKKHEDIKKFFSQKNSPLIVFDPFVGNGEITVAILKTMAEYYYKKKQYPLKALLYINDISENMLCLAKKRLNIFQKQNTNKINLVDIKTTNVNFLDDKARSTILLSSSVVDVTIISQVLDVIKGIESKNLVLTLLHDYLKIGGRMTVIGEDPSRFSLEKDSDPMIILLFKMIFDPIDKNATEAEIKRIRNGRLVIVGESSAPIDESHSAFIRIAERIYRQSEKKEEE